MRLLVQNKITEMCKTGTFPQVTYDKETKLATVSTEKFLEPAVVVNEVSGSLTISVNRSSRARRYTHDTWTFEARLKFTSEVSFDYFLDNELDIIMISADGVKATTTNIGYNIAHPPRQGSHNGTEAVVTYNLTTRR